MSVYKYLCVECDSVLNCGKKHSKGDWDRRNCLFRKGGRTYFFAATRTSKEQGEGVSDILLPVAARLWLPGETRPPKYQMSEHVPLSPPNPACPSWHQGTVPFPTHFPLPPSAESQTIHWGFSWVDLTFPRCGLTPPQGPRRCENQWKISSSFVPRCPSGHTEW